MSKINLHNYESFLLDYLEGNLPAELVADLLIFLEENPAVKSELDDFEIVNVSPKLHQLHDKTNLKKNINSENVENYIIEKIEKEISQDDLSDLTSFLKNNLESRILEKRYEKTILSAPEISFPNKFSLKKRSRIIALYPLAAAAAIILLFLLIDSPVTDTKYSPGLPLHEIAESSIDTSSTLPVKNIAIVSPEKEEKNSTNKNNKTYINKEIALIQEDTISQNPDTMIVPIEKIIPDNEEIAVNETDHHTSEKNDSVVSATYEDNTLALGEWANKQVRQKIFNQEQDNTEKIQKEEVLLAMVNGLDKITKPKISYDHTTTEESKSFKFSVGNFEFSRTKKRK